MQKLLLVALAIVLFASTASSDELSAADLDTLAISALDALEAE